MTRFVAAVLVVLGCSVHAQQARDGNWWDSLGNGFGQNARELAQLTYISGFIAGMYAGSVDVEFNVVVGRQNGDSCSAAAIDAFKKADHYTDGITVGQARDGFSDFFKDYRNRSISVPHAIDVVLRSIKGEDVERLIIAYQTKSRLRVALCALRCLSRTSCTDCAAARGMNALGRLEIRSRTRTCHRVGRGTSAAKNRLGECAPAGDGGHPVCLASGRVRISLPRA